MTHVGDGQTAAAEDGYGHTGKTESHTFLVLLCFASFFAETGQGGRGGLVEGVE